MKIALTIGKILTNVLLMTAAIVWSEVAYLIVFALGGVNIISSIEDIVDETADWK